MCADRRNASPEDDFLQRLCFRKHVFGNFRDPGTDRDGSDLASAEHTLRNRNDRVGDHICPVVVRREGNERRHAAVIQSAVLIERIRHAAVGDRELDACVCERVGADGGQRVGKHERRQRRTAVERILADRLQAGKNIHQGKLRTVPERIVSDARNVTGDMDGLQRGAALKRIVPDGDRLLRYRKGEQADAAFERVGRDRRYRSGQLHGFQGKALLEHVVSQRRQDRPLFHSDTDKGICFRETVGSDRLDACRDLKGLQSRSGEYVSAERSHVVRESHRLQHRTIAERKVRDRCQSGGKFCPFKARAIAEDIISERRHAVGQFDLLDRSAFKRPGTDRIQGAALFKLDFGKGLCFLKDI